MIFRGLVVLVLVMCSVRISPRLVVPISRLFITACSLSFSGCLFPSLFSV